MSVGMSASAARGATMERTGFAAWDASPRWRVFGATAARADIDVAAALEASAKDMVLRVCLELCYLLCFLWQCFGGKGGSQVVVSRSVPTAYARTRRRARVCICANVSCGMSVVRARGRTTEVFFFRGVNLTKCVKGKKQKIINVDSRTARCGTRGRLLRAGNVQPWNFSCLPRAQSINAVKTQKVGARWEGKRTRSPSACAIDVAEKDGEGRPRHLASVPAFAANHRLEISRISNRARRSSLRTIYFFSQYFRRLRSRSFGVKCPTVRSNRCCSTFNSHQQISYGSDPALALPIMRVLA